MPRLVGASGESKDHQPEHKSSDTARASNVNIFLTGVSSGIGHALAGAYLDQGAQVFGTSRRTPQDLLKRSGFSFESLDLLNAPAVEPTLKRLLAEVDRLELAILNAGILGQFGDLQEADFDDLRATMQVNVWANQLILNALSAQKLVIDQVVAISSGASLNGNRGWSGYAISKAALNMLMKLHAQEKTSTHFCALAPGLIETAMQDQLQALPDDQRYPSLQRLRSRRGTSEMPNPRAAAEKLIPIFAQLPRSVTSGDYADIRQLPAERINQV